MPERSSAVERGLWSGAGAIVLWRLMALFNPHTALSDPALVRTAMVPVGLLFVACGLWAYRQAPGAATTLFALHALCAGMHWGGSVGVGPPPLQTMEIVLYLILSSTLSQTLLLHLSLVFPRPLSLATRPAGLLLLYAPTLAGGVLAFLAAVAPVAVETIVGPGVQALSLAGMLFGVAAVVIWIVRLSISREERRAGRLPLLVGGLLASALPNLIVSAIGPLSEFDGLTNLFVALEPVVFAFVLTRGPEPMGRAAPVTP